MTEPTAHETAETPTERGLPPWFCLTVGSLLLVIIAALTGLTLRFYKEKKLAEAEIRRLRDAQPSAGASLEQLLKLKPGQSLRVKLPPDSSDPPAEN